ncbi:integral membrane protein Pth11-like protein [Aspergillus karnatakaensis]|uniref:integral membrane protein Pth11-like protein n=1 Tax=Aspergillus karnatakaensis TaxID=1810916 RepID=UPI003CCE337A
MASPFGEPPPGIDLSESHTARNNAITIALTVLATVAVALRMIARVKVQQVKFAADDWFIVASLIPTYAILACTIVGGQYGLGKHVWVVPMDHITRVNQTHFAYVLIYVWAIPLIKLSIIFFYRRIFGTTPIMYLCGFLTIGYFIACTIAFSACCRPPSYYWTQYADPTGGHCVFDLYPFYIGNAAANVATDLLILVVPVPLVWKLQMRTVQKGLVMGIFMLGSFVCIASIIRIYYMIPLKHNLDVTWIMADVYVWSSVEPCIGILCACLPTLQPLIRRTLKKIMGSSVARGRFGNSDSRGGGTSSSVRQKSRTNEDRGRGRRKTKKPRGVFQQFDESEFRPDGDEALLTTTMVEGMGGGVEMDEMDKSKSTSKSRERDGRGSIEEVGIQVKTDFQWREEHK